MGIGEHSFQAGREGKSTLDFLKYCQTLGAGGIQMELTSREPEFLRMLRRDAEALGMYLEVSLDLPQDDTTGFERTVKAAKEAGAQCLRAACLEGRRYEDFSKLEDWRAFVAASRARLERALRVLEIHRIALAVENHKDWTADELASLLKEFSSEYLGACIDTGNNIALLDDPGAVVARLAPFAVATHVKDMAAEQYPEGFLLAEVPLGEGILDLKGIVETIRRARPRTQFTLEMITRNPLTIPCLTPKYWATFPERSGAHLARTLAMVRAQKPRLPLARMEGLVAAARWRLEEENVKKCLVYAREQLGL